MPRNASLAARVHEVCNLLAALQLPQPSRLQLSRRHVGLGSGEESCRCWIYVFSPSFARCCLRTGAAKPSTVTGLGLVALPFRAHRPTQFHRQNLRWGGNWHWVWWTRRRRCRRWAGSAAALGRACTTLSRSRSRNRQRLRRQRPPQHSRSGT